METTQEKTAPGHRWGKLCALVNCPACGYYNPPTQQTCSHCSLLLPIPAGDALCAVHPDVNATGACSRCGTFGCGPCLSQRGTSWLCAACLLVTARLPWDDRQALGLWRAWWRTSVLLISAPNRTLSTTEPDAPLGSSLLFGLLSTAVGFGPTLLMTLPLSLIGLLGGPKDGALTASIASVAGSFINVFAVLASQLGFVFIVSGLEHLALQLLGANPRSYSVSVRAHVLGMAPFLLGLFPLCSIYVFPIWAIVVRIFATMHLHKTTAGKASAAVLIPIALSCGCVFALYAAVIGLAIGLAR